MNSSATKIKISGLDPNIGFCHLDSKSWSLEGDEEYVDGIVRLKKSNNNKNTIVVSGGSTSDIAYNGSWLRFFNQLLLESKFDYSLYSVGVSGYSSNQELFKLIRDVVPLNPSIYISLSGVNDLGFIQSIDSMHPYMHHYTAKVFNKLNFQKNKNLFKKIVQTRHEKDNFIEEYKRNNNNLCLGLCYNIEDYELWFKNIKHMFAICKSEDIDFVGILQPIYGFGNYNKNEKEVKAFREFCEKFFEMKNINYDDLLQNFYINAKILCNKFDFLLDFTDIFNDEHEVFEDPRHLNQKGNKILAKRIFDTIVCNLN